MKKILQTVAALPHGVIKMSADIPGLVETSTNVAVVKTDKKGIQVETSQRSSVASEIVDMADSVYQFVDNDAVTAWATIDQYDVPLGPSSSYGLERSTLLVADNRISGGPVVLEGTLGAGVRCRIADNSFEAVKVPEGGAVLRPADGPWKFEGKAGVCNVKLQRGPAIVSAKPGAPAAALRRACAVARRCVNPRGPARRGALSRRHHARLDSG